MTVYTPFPLGGHDLHSDRAAEKPPVEGKPAPPGEHYRRLFGPIPPALAIIPIDPTSLRGDGNLGPPLNLSSDPKEAAAGRFYFTERHPSAAALASVAALRLRHIEKGHSPETDAAHGPVFFMAAARAWWQRAQGARTADARRKAIVAAAAIFVAMIDAHDFTTQPPQEPTP